MPVEKQKSSPTGKELGISRLIDAPRDLVWELWTRPEHIRHWWGPDGFTNTIHKMEVKKDGEWEFIMHGPDGTDYKNKHVYREVIKPEKLVMEHISGPRFIMTVRFEAKGRKTLVSIHSEFESAEKLQEVIRVFRADEGMKQNITRMEKYATERLAGTPFSMERTYNAPIEKVWEAITNLEQMKEWYFQMDGFRPEVGFEFRFSGRGKHGEEYIHICRVLEADPKKKLSYSWTYEGLPGYSVVTFALTPEGEKTRVKLTHEGLDSFPRDNADFAKENFVEGWTHIIGKSLKEFVE